MKICLVGPWFKRHGIARYHWGLCEALLDKGHEVIVWCPWEPGSGDDWETEPISSLTGSYQENKAKINSCDVIHLQSESIYAKPGFDHVLGMLHDPNRPPVVQTLHSNCNHYLSEISFLFVHNTTKLFQDVWQVHRPLVQVPMWSPKVSPVEPPDEDRLWIRWKTNGRTDEKYLRAEVALANEQLERKYELDLSAQWMSDEALITFLQSSNLFTPLYFKTDAVARSNTYTWMAATGRPLLVSDSHWFEGINNPSCVVATREPHKHLVDIANNYSVLLAQAKQEAERMQREDTWDAMVDRIYLPYYRKAMAGERLD